MKKILVLAIILLTFLLVVLFVLIYKRQTTPIQSGSIVEPTTAPPSQAPQQVVYPEYLLPSPRQLAPPNDTNNYDHATKSEQDFSDLMIQTPITKEGMSVTFNYADSTFAVIITTDKGMDEYLAIRKKYPGISEVSFVVSDQRPK